MEFDLDKSIEILERTPRVLSTYLEGVSDGWLRNHEGAGTWSPYDVVGHLIYGEKTDWIPRLRIILSDSDHKLFEPFDRFAQLNEDQNRPLTDLLSEFALLRRDSLEELRSFNLTKDDLSRVGIHPDPAFGQVTAKQLLATWTVHDLGHIGQISRVMAKQYRNEVGPWANYLGVLK